MRDYILVCPHCFAINDVVQRDFVDPLICRYCVRELLPGVPIDADEALFNCFITYSTLPIIVDFWGEWSGISHEMADFMFALAGIFKQDAIFLRINSEQQQVIANNYKLIDIPTFIIFKSGVECQRLNGFISEPEFHRCIERQLQIKRKGISRHPSSV